MNIIQRNIGFGLIVMLSSCLVGCSYTPPTPTTEDERITAAVRAAYAKTDYILGGYAIRVRTADGIVYITGPVDTQQEWMDVDELTRKIPGVKDVYNELWVNTFRD